jgi:hypothetical protein
MIKVDHFSSWEFIFSVILSGKFWSFNGILVSAGYL